MGFSDIAKGLGNAAGNALGLGNLGDAFSGVSTDPMAAVRAQINSGQEINKQNLAFAREQMKWQETMSNTAHQREVQDLRAAGINPIMTMGGKGASTGSPVSAKLENPHQGTADTIQAHQASKRQAATAASAQAIDRMATMANIYQTMKMNDATIREKEAAINRTNADTARVGAETAKLGRDEKLFPQIQAQMEATLKDIYASANAHNSAAELSHQSARGKSIESDVMTGMVEAFGEIAVGLGLDKHLGNMTSGIVGQTFQHILARRRAAAKDKSIQDAEKKSGDFWEDSFGIFNMRK